MSVAHPPHGTLTFATPASRATLARRARAGQALRLAPGIYAVGATLAPENVARHHLFAITAAHWPDGVLCARTALAGGAPVDGWVFVASPDPARRGPLKLPGVTVAPVVGPGALPGDMSLPHGLVLSGLARQLVENVDTPGRPPRHRAGTAAAEDRIDEIARNGGPSRIRQALGELDVIAGSFDPRSTELVRSRLSAVLGTFTEGVRSERLASRVSGSPYDAHRVEILDTLVTELNEVAPTPLPSGDSERWTWLSFYEAYFSNFIEGTEFGVDEARRIAIEGHEPLGRPADAHDIAATYRLANDPEDRERTPESGDELADLCRERHRILMAARPEMRPCLFKEKRSYAGGYAFVDPELVDGTLNAGIDTLAGVVDPLLRAVALMVLVTETHPFDDGNGRIARLVANAELSRASQSRIVIPTVFRNNYLAGLTGVSNEARGSARGLWSIMSFAQRWTASVNWTTYKRALAQLESTHAFTDPGYAESQGIHLELAAAPL